MVSFLKAIKGFFRLKSRLSKANARKIVVGASGVFENGWIPTDVHTLNLLTPDRWRLFFKPGTIDAILGEHVWEHLSLSDGITAANTCYKYLKKGGYARIAVPDGLHPDKTYIDYVKPGGHGPGADDHKVLYTYQTLSEVFREAGFRVITLEYFDEAGQFHFTDWNKEQGMIHRSRRYDERNADGQLKYTSIIIDAFK